MDNQKAIDILNTLIVINNDRFEGYFTASLETDNYDLKILFSEFSQTSISCKKELATEVQKLGGIPTEGTSVSGDFYNIWMDIKAAITGNDVHAIINSCAYGESVALDAYNEKLRNNTRELSFDQQTILYSQYDLIKADSEKIKLMQKVSVS
jgi:uncharacterized protein (TIGR02284 family)